jgi:thioredoxin reductase (NADPH)
MKDMVKSYRNQAMQPWEKSGGNSGFEEGLFLTRFADQVDIVEYMPEVRASQSLQEQVARNENMTVTVNHQVKAFKGKHHLESVRIIRCR